MKNIIDKENKKQTYHIDSLFFIYFRGTTKVAMSNKAKTSTVLNEKTSLNAKNAWKNKLNESIYNKNLSIFDK